MENNEKYNYPLVVKILQNENFIKNKHVDLEILFNLKGSANLIVGAKEYQFNQNDIILINQTENYQIIHLNGIVACITIKRSRLELDDAIKQVNFYCNSCTYDNKSVFLQLQTIITTLISEYNKPNFTIIKAFSYAYTIIDELNLSFPTTKVGNTYQKTKMDEILDYIEINYANNLSLNELADEFNFSIPYLSNLFKRNLNMNFTDYYDDVRLRHSIKDLLETNLPIIDIALKNGFASNHAFLRAYKQKYNELPSETRKNKKEQSIVDEIASKEDKGIEELLKDLKQETEKNLTNNLYKEVLINAYEKQKPLFTIDPNPATISISVNNARNISYSGIRKVLIDAKEKFNVKYVYLCGIFSDNLYFCSRTKSGRLYFRFNLINEILDFLISENLTPVLSLTYMPQALARDKNKTIFADEYNTSPPNKIEEWVLLLETFFNHIIERYSYDVVKNWIFIPWRQPDTDYNYMGFSSNLEFFNFYKITWQTIKNISKDFIVSSPELIPISSKKIEWFKEFFTWTKENFCLPNYVALEFYMDDDWDVLETYNLRGKSFQRIPYTKPTNDENRLKKYLTNVRNLLNLNSTRIPIIITQYNFTISHYNVLQDTIFMADFIIKNIIDNIEKVKGFTYYRISDFEETLADMNYFSGGTGLYYKNGIPKPNLHALSFLSKLEKYVISRGENYILTSNESNTKLVLILHNYEHPNADLIGDDLYIKPVFDRYSPFVNKTKKKINLMYKTSHNKVKMEIHSITRKYGSPYDRWLDCGKPPIDTYNRLINTVFDAIKIASYPDYQYREINVTQNNLSAEFLLEPLEIKLIEIKLYD